MTYRPPLTWLTTLLKQASAVMFIALVLIAGGLVLSMKIHWHAHVRGMVPSALEPSFLYSGDEGASMGLVRFSLGGDALHSIKAQGIAFLNREAGSGWQPTPVPIERFRPMDDCSGFWCSRSEGAVAAAQWTAAPGSYVHIRSELNNDRVIVVNPDEGSLILGYNVD